MLTHTHILHHFQEKSSVFLRINISFTFNFQKGSANVRLKRENGRKSAKKGSFSMLSVFSWIDQYLLGAAGDHFHGRSNDIVGRRENGGTAISSSVMASP